MQSQQKFSFLRSFLRTFGLSPKNVDDIISRVGNLLSGTGRKVADLRQYPYLLRDNFLSPAELSFYLVLKNLVGDRAVISTKVNLGDLFYVKSHDRSEFRTYTNKVDRKHVDFLLCDPKTIHPLVGIELDDKSHKRSDRKTRDDFVEMVFRAAQMPLLRVPAQRAYSSVELASLLRPHINLDSVEIPSVPTIPEKENTAPRCPKCGLDMVLRTAKKGSNQGAKFWGCPAFPNCRGILTYVPTNIANLVMEKEEI